MLSPAVSVAAAKSPMAPASAPPMPPPAPPPPLPPAAPAASSAVSFTLVIWSKPSSVRLSCWTAFVAFLAAPEAAFPTPSMPLIASPVPPVILSIAPETAFPMAPAAAFTPKSFCIKALNRFAAFTSTAIKRLSAWITGLKAAISPCPIAALRD